MPETPRKDSPLSPHIQIYKWQWTSILSILHRLTGLLLGPLLIIFLGWIGSLALGEAAYTVFQHLIQNPAGKIALGTCCFSFYYHLANGIRHLVWDMGAGYILWIAMLSGWTTVIISITATVLTLQGF
jgi:succinate dehydrogenase / fumarate reductase cytochrome b subunit